MPFFGLLSNLQPIKLRVIEYLRDKEETRNGDPTA